MSNINSNFSNKSVTPSDGNANTPVQREDQPPSPPSNRRNSISDADKTRENVAKNLAVMAPSLGSRSRSPSPLSKSKPGPRGPSSLGNIHSENAESQLFKPPLLSQRPAGAPVQNPDSSPAGSSAPSTVIAAQQQPDQANVVLATILSAQSSINAGDYDNLVFEQLDSTLNVNNNNSLVSNSPQQPKQDAPPHSAPVKIPESPVPEAPLGESIDQHNVSEGTAHLSEDASLAGPSPEKPPEASSPESAPTTPNNAPELSPTTNAKARTAAYSNLEIAATAVYNAYVQNQKASPSASAPPVSDKDMDAFISEYYEAVNAYDATLGDSAPAAKFEDRSKEILEEAESNLNKLWPEELHNDQEMLKKFYNFLKPRLDLLNSPSPNIAKINLGDKHTQAETSLSSAPSNVSSGVPKQAGDVISQAQRGTSASTSTSTSTSAPALLDTKASSTSSSIASAGTTTAPAAPKVKLSLEASMEKLLNTKSLEKAKEHLDNPIIAETQAAKAAARNKAAEYLKLLNDPNTNSINHEHQLEQIEKLITKYNEKLHTEREYRLSLDILEGVTNGPPQTAFKDIDKNALKQVRNDVQEEINSANLGESFTCTLERVDIWKKSTSNSSQTPSLSDAQNQGNRTGSHEEIAGELRALSGGAYQNSLPGAFAFLKQEQLENLKKKTKEYAAGFERTNNNSQTLFWTKAFGDVLNNPLLKDGMALDSAKTRDETTKLQEKLNQAIEARNNRKIQSASTATHAGMASSSSSTSSAFTAPVKEASHVEQASDKEDVTRTAAPSAHEAASTGTDGFFMGSIKGALGILYTLLQFLNVINILFGEKGAYKKGVNDAWNFCTTGFSDAWHGLVGRRG